MKITVIGTGYVGLVTGTCLAEIGHTVVCVDTDAPKIARLKQGIMPIFEDDLENVVARNVQSGRLLFTTDLKEAMHGTKAIFIGVGTPSVREKEQSLAAADLSQVKGAAQEIARNLKDYTVIINKSTVPVGTARLVVDIIHTENPTADFAVVSNPEFLREGTAVKDFMNPDRVVVGLEDDRAGSVLREIYQPMIDQGVQYLETTPATSEMIKYASNALLATKISFINEMADLCERVGADVEDLATGIGMDSRIGPKFLKPGPGFGGSCFPKDTDALAYTAQQYGAPVHIVESVIESNNARKQVMFEKIVASCGGDVNGKTIAVLGLTFKANTDDVRQSVSLIILPLLTKAGAVVKAYDPQGMENAKGIMPQVIYASSMQDALENADACVILTEWDEFVALDWGAVKNAMATPLLIDLRNILDPKAMEQAGIEYYCIGRKAPDIDPKNVVKLYAQS